MSASTVSCVSRISRRENSSRRMRRRRVFGNESVRFPVIWTVTPNSSVSRAVSAPPRRLGRHSARRPPSPAAAPAFRLRHSRRDALILSRDGYRKPALDLNMKDDVGGNLQRARFQALCRTLRPDLLRFAFWLSRDLALAEDVVQETMLRAWKARDSLKDEAAAKPWLLTIIRREYARSFERKRLATVDVDELIAKEEPMLAASQDQDLAEL